MSEREPSAPEAMTEVEAELEEIEVDAPRVGIVMGSKSDMPEMEKAGEGARGARHPLRDPRDVGAPRSRGRRRLRQERAHARAAGDHRRRRAVGGAARACVAAHTDLPVIGVPLTSRNSVAGGLDAAARPSCRCRRACRSPASGSTTRRATRRSSRRGSSARDRALHARPSWARSGPTRPAWRLAAGRGRRAEELDGPDRGRRHRGDPRAPRSPSRPCRSASGSPTTTSPRSSTCSAESAGDGRALDPLRPDLLRRARHGAGAAARGAPARWSLAGARRARARRSPTARASTPTRSASGRTHGVHAEPTTFGLKLAGFAFEAHRNARAARAGVRAGRGRRDLGRRRHLLRARARLRGARARRGWASRASASPPRSSPRDRHAELLQAIALAGAGLERLATEIRHLQRTEVREVEEPFREGQKGSSAMPHKRNPITRRADHRPRARAARQRAGRGSRTSRCGTSATSRTPRPSA